MKKLVKMLTLSSLLLASCQEENVGRRGDDEGAGRQPNLHQYYQLDTDQSVVEWWGRSLETEHHGSFSVQGRFIEVVGSKVKKGTFTIPIVSIKNFDLPEEFKTVLLDHLKSSDFFNLALYPNASFILEEMVPTVKDAEGAMAGANCTLSGDFTMLDKTLEISFPAKVVISDKQLFVSAKFSIDRTQWGMTYGTDSTLGDHYIYPDVDLHLKLSASRH